MPTEVALPTIDLRHFREEATREAFVAELRDAFAQHGFFYLIGHGVESVHRLDAMTAARNFFALPHEAKLEVDSVKSPHVRGFSQLGRERTVGVMDIREVWEMGPDACCIDADTVSRLPPYMRLQGPNIWPRQPANFRGALECMFRDLGQVCAELMRAVALALGQPACETVD